jgi:hypothetical protein
MTRKALLFLALAAGTFMARDGAAEAPVETKTIV